MCPVSGSKSLCVGGLLRGGRGYVGSQGKRKTHAKPKFLKEERCHRCGKRGEGNWIVIGLGKKIDMANKLKKNNRKRRKER